MRISYNVPTDKENLKEKEHLALTVDEEQQRSTICLEYIDSLYLVRKYLGAFMITANANLLHA